MTEGVTGTCEPETVMSFPSLRGKRNRGIASDDCFYCLPRGTAEYSFSRPSGIAAPADRNGGTKKTGRSGRRGIYGRTSPSVRAVP
ncbi:hypothetical protein GCM10018980_52890 [Streptomyces capoamus]|uniref:Uncharacterized protein n=1 Tax=Streptomyces capoamus TaxID=68183 RepID=A0A919EZG6_9ACTN|nr:hypothetical protein GCM10010501_43000 [Streptomyces libani subsp. rufus]GHG62817.1 hypothetical protein GCM10018980_52890 [Streptomyces capoamus]